MLAMRAPTAPYIFTKLLKLVVQKFHELDIILVIYLDEILIIAKSEGECDLNTQKKQGF